MWTSVQKLLVEVTLVVEVLADIHTIILMNGDPCQCRDLEKMQVLDSTCQGHSRPTLSVPMKGSNQYSTPKSTLLQVSDCTWGSCNRDAWDTPVGFQSNKPMESVTANCADRFLAVSSYGQTMSDRCVDKVQAYEWRRAKSWVFHNQRIKTLSLSATTLVLVEEGRGDNLRFKD